MVVVAVGESLVILEGFQWCFEVGMGPEWWMRQGRMLGVRVRVWVLGLGVEGRASILVGVLGWVGGVVVFYRGDLGGGGVGSIE